MNHIPQVLRAAARLINEHGLHTGTQFVGPDGSYDLAAAIYHAGAMVLPDAFRTDAATALTLIKSCERAMDAIRAFYSTLQAAYPEVHSDDEVIDTVSVWAEKGDWGPEQQPPTTSEVIGRLLRLADTLATQDTTTLAA